MHNASEAALGCDTIYGFIFVYLLKDKGIFILSKIIFQWKFVLLENNPYLCTVN